MPDVSVGSRLDSGPEVEHIGYKLAVFGLLIDFYLTTC